MRMQGPRRGLIITPELVDDTPSASQAAKARSREKLGRVARLLSLGMHMGMGMGTGMGTGTGTGARARARARTRARAEDYPPALQQLAGTVSLLLRALRVLCAARQLPEDAFRCVLCDRRAGEVLEVDAGCLAAPELLHRLGTPQHIQDVRNASAFVQRALGEVNCWNRVICTGFAASGGGGGGSSGGGGGGSDGWETGVALIAFERSTWQRVEATLPQLRGAADLPKQLAKILHRKGLCRRYDLTSQMEPDRLLLLLETIAAEPPMTLTECARCGGSSSSSSSSGSSSGLLRCSGCSWAVYCSAECQKKDRPAHKQGCKAIAAAVEASGMRRAERAAAGPT
jgi:uncharacterized membrane protein YgcG